MWACTGGCTWVGYLQQGVESGVGAWLLPTLLEMLEELVGYLLTLQLLQSLLLQLQLQGSLLLLRGTHVKIIITRVRCRVVQARVGKYGTVGNPPP